MTDLKVSDCCHADISLVPAERTPETATGRHFDHICKRCERECDIEWVTGERIQDDYVVEYTCPFCEGTVLTTRKVKYCFPPYQTIECKTCAREINYQNFYSRIERKPIDNPSLFGSPLTEQ